MSRLNSRGVLCVLALLAGGCSRNTSSVGNQSTPTKAVQLQALTITETPPTLTPTVAFLQPTYPPSPRPRTPLPTRTPNPRYLEKIREITTVVETQVAFATYVALTPQPPTPTYPPPQTPWPLPTGILPTAHIGIRMCECGFESAWRQVHNNEYLEVFTGHYTNPADQGMVMVLTRTLDYGPTSKYFYNTPARAGSVHIVSVDGMRLTLATPGGQQFVFDAEQRTWINP
jgi:hypothetical protein